MVHNSKIKRISLAVCLALMPFAADAAGLGRLTVLSGLGEPLNAEIELLSAGKDELSTLSARIAPAETYAEQGVDRAATLGGIKVELSSKPDGMPVLKLTSSQPVNDPFLDMLVQVEWSTGRLLREYTALLDPPGYGERTAAVSTPSVSATPQAEMLPGQAPEKKARVRKGAAPTHAAKPASEGGEAAAPMEGYKTKSGDTLHSIAGKMQVEGVSLEQMLVGLYRANKEAFAGDNMNRLKVGQILRAPGVDELQAVSREEAAKEIRVQAADWNAYRNKLAGAVAEAAPSARDEEQKQAVSGKITAHAEDKAAVSPGPRDVIKLSRSDTAPVKAGAPEAKGAALQEKLNSLQEEAAAREKAVKDASERVASLEKQIQDMQKLLQVKNQVLAEVQKGATAQPKPAEQPKAPEVAKPVEPSKAPESAAKVPEAKPETLSAPEKPEVKEQAKPETPPTEAKKPKKLLKPKPVPVESKPEPGMLDQLTEDPLLLGGAGGGLLALLGGAWFYLRNKRKKGLDSFEQGILTTGGLKPNTVFGNTAGGTVDTGDTSFLTDFSQGAGGSVIDTNDVDPIAEAEVYMAYGRDVQAEEILKDAIGKDPKRYELHQKLLEIYANRKDTESFETLAGELYASLGATDPVWAKVAEMGRKVEADNPLYESGNIPTHETGAIVPEAAAEPAAEGGLDFGAEAGAEPSLDFSLDNLAGQAPEAAIQDNSLDFDLGLPGDVGEVAAAPEPLAEIPMPDLDLALPESGAPELPVAETAEAEEVGLDFRLDLPEPAAEENVQLEAADLGMELVPEIGGLSAEPSLELPSLEAVEPLARIEESVPAGMPVAEPSAEAVVESPGLELPELELPEIGLVEAAAAEVPESPELPDISFELPTMEAGPAAEAVEAPVVPEDISFELPAAEQLSAPPAAAEEVELPSLELPPAEPDDMDKTMVLQVPSAEAEEIVFDATPAEENALDFNFDVELAAEEPAEVSAPEPEAAAMPDLDLSGISLDLGEQAQEEPQEALGEEITLSGSESPDVDTKLDLVTAYMDMGDTEGARELLEEVLREGGPNQRERAQEMLDSLS